MIGETRHQELVDQIGRRAWLLIVVREIKTGELMLTAATGAQAWLVTGPHPQIAALPFYQALLGVGPVALWAVAWWTLFGMALIGMVTRCLALRRLTMGLLVFAWWFTGVVEFSAGSRLGILAPFGFVFAGGAMWHYWRLNLARRRND